MSLNRKVSIARRFQRAVRIDTDYNDIKALEGFICTKSSAEVLSAIGQYSSETKHGAFTWTGPYGSGKSSLVVALSALLSGNKNLASKAKDIIGNETAQSLLQTFPSKSKGWITLPVIGRRENASQVIGETLERQGLVKKRSRKKWSDNAVITELIDLSNRHPRSEGGIILFVDEMGKFLEAATQEGGDVYLFQLLAEAASHSQRRFLFIGILHQSFEEYANRLSREIRDEWSKIQGRFIDFAVNAVGEEQIEMIGRAIRSRHSPSRSSRVSKSIALEIRRNRPGASRDLPEMLESCWPLHPIVACLIGPISRRRFGQNQRSIFGFLNSPEPFGFQEFIRNNRGKTLFEPNMLWDYLNINLEPSILASPDGHRWAMASEAINRCESLGGDDFPLKLLKSIVLIDMFRDRSGLMPTKKVLKSCVKGHTESEVSAALKQLEAWSLITFRKFTDSYSIYAGSDFDIDSTVRDALENVREANFEMLQKLADIQPILAKRHYDETGALRWFDVSIAPLNELVDRARTYVPSAGSIGVFFLAIPTESETSMQAQKISRKVVNESRDWDIVVGLSKSAWGITSLARELIAYSEILDRHPDLAGDIVAQREVKARYSILQGQLEEEFQRAFENASWYQEKHEPKQWHHADLNNIASQLAAKRYHQSPRLNNELLNRIRPSSNAVAAQNALLRAMVTKESEPSLGIIGFPAEGGLYASLLEKTGLHIEGKSGWQFSTPGARNDPCYLFPLWEKTDSFLRQHEDRTVSITEVYALWSTAPFGLKDGLMPVLMVAFILSRREQIALYREGVFQARFKDIDVEVLAKNADLVQVRWMDLSMLSRQLLSSMAEVVRKLDTGNNLVQLTPIDVARGLISIFDCLHSWTKRTSQLSANAIRVRDLFKLAKDPNKFLFDDIPTAFGGHEALDNDQKLNVIVHEVQEGLQELVDSYPSMLHRLNDLMLAELQVPNASTQALGELQSRAENIKEIGGDFRLSAFIGRLASFNGSGEDIEGIAGLAANRPPRDWTDPDLERATVELADLSQKFIRAENFARVKGRTDKRHAIAVVIGVNGRPAPVHAEFEVTDTDIESIEQIVNQVKGMLESDSPSHGNRNLILAALAELSSQYIVEGEENKLMEKAL
ncbi:MAG: ATP-binding protein [Gammaproteobacteria bacterium]|nr:ATP-binding protein [Gammaproteobacteria bacterium]